jgi:hypothetical protein
MHKIFVMYRLKNGVSMDQYKHWSKEIDQRITPGQPGLIRFEVYEIKGAEKGEPFVQVVEDIEVEDFDAWMETCRQQGMAYVIETVGKFIDESTLQVIYGKRIVSDLPHGARPPLPALG